jgi:putative ABC transport system permease protein
MSRVIFTLRVLLSHWVRHPMQLATLLVGLAAATSLWSGVQAINVQARTSYDRAAASFGGATAPMLIPTQTSTVPQSTFAALRRAGWLVSPVVEGRVRVAGRSVRIIGIEPLSLPRGAGPAPSVGEEALQDFLSSSGQALIGVETARQLGAREGETLAAEDGRALPPLHIVDDLAPNLLVMDIGFAQQVLKMPERVSRFLLDQGGGARTPLREIAGDDLRLVEAGAETDLQRLTASFHLNLTAFGLLSFLVGLFIVHSAAGLAFEQRLPMLRTLRACGLSPLELVATLIAELVLLALAAGAGGVACG